MVKKIQCRVIRTGPFASLEDKPFAERRSNFQHSNRTNNKYRRAGDVAANVRFSHTNNSVTYTGRLGIVRVSINNGPMGQILDCYV